MYIKMAGFSKAREEARQINEVLTNPETKARLDKMVEDIDSLNSRSVKKLLLEMGLCLLPSTSSSIQALKLLLEITSGKITFPDKADLTEVYTFIIENLKPQMVLDWIPRCEIPHILREIINACEKNLNAQKEMRDAEVQMP